MSSLREYLNKKSDEELRGVLRTFCVGINDYSADAVLIICEVLAQRDPQLPDPKVLFLSLCRMYM